MATMGFLTNDNKKEMTPIVKTDFTNAICYGKTGSGKTTGFILPNIEERIKQNHGILVYDFKSTLHTQVKYLASKYDKLDSVVEIGVPWGKKINLLSDINTKELRSFYNLLHGNSSDKYWQNASYNLFEGIFNILKNISLIEDIMLKLKDKTDIDYPLNITINYQLSISNIYNNVNSVESLVRFLKNTTTTLDRIDYLLFRLVQTNKISIEKYLKQIAYHYDEALKANDGLESYSKLSSENADNQSGKYGVISVLNSTINSLATYDFLNEDKFNIADALRDGKIVIINVNDINPTILSLINNLAYNKLQLNILTKNKADVTIFIDEAQKVLSEYSLPDVDICRESKFEYILATQDKELLYSSIGLFNTEQLVKNLVTQYSFSTNNNDGTETLKQFEYKDLILNKTFMSKPIFIDYKQLFDVEYKYQKINDILNLIDNSYKNRYILKYIPYLYDKNQILLEFQNQTQKTVEISKAKDDILDRYKSNQLSKTKPIYLSNLETLLDDIEIPKEVELSTVEMELEPLSVEEEIVNLKKTIKLLTLNQHDQVIEIHKIKKHSTSFGNAAHTAVKECKRIQEEIVELSSMVTQAVSKLQIKIKFDNRQFS